ncbi:MAG: T9SS type A sorting domain-containing protein [Bacteroidota bacterium]
MRRLFLPILFCLPLLLSAQDWQLVGSAGFSQSTVFNNSLAIHQDTPYVAYVDRGGLNFAKFDGTNWVLIGAPNFVLTAGNPKLAFRSNTPYLLYKDGSLGGKLVLMRYEENAWVKLGDFIPSEGGSNFPSLAFDQNDVPYVAFQDNGTGFKTVVLRYEAGMWLHVGPITGFGRAIATNQSLAIDGETPYVCFTDSDFGGTSVMRYDMDLGWVDVGAPGLNIGAANAPILQIDDGKLYVACLEQAQGLKITVVQFDGTDWQIVGRRGFNKSEVPILRFKVDQGIPYCGFRDGATGFKASVWKFENTEWQPLGQEGFSAGEAGLMSLAIGREQVYLSFQDEANDNKLSVMNLGMETTGLKKEIQDSPVVLYPNPTNGYLLMKHPLPSTKAIRIVAPTGEYIKEVSHTATTIDVSDLSPGLYLLEIQLGERSILKKFIKR